MSIQSADTLSVTLDQLRSDAKAVKAGWVATALSTLQTRSVTTDEIFALLDLLRSLIARLNAYNAVSGLATRYGQEYPAYGGTLSTDIVATRDAAQGCIDWVFTNFPKDAGGFLMGYTLLSDGSRTPRNFTTAQTAGLQTALSNLIASVS